MTDRDDKIREIAYFLWLEEGCPEGHAERHWRDAEALFESEPEPFESMRIKGASSAEPSVTDSLAPRRQAAGRR